MLRRRLGITLVFTVGLAVPAGAQLSKIAPDVTADIAADPSADAGGFALPDSERVRVAVDMLAGYGTDRANATLGFERQGRVGYATITAFGKISPRLSFLLSINPVAETAPRPSCGSQGYFFPNDPKFLYGTSTDVACDPGLGNRRVDGYRGIALDVVPQQGALREAYVGIGLSKNLTLQAGRMRLPIGFDWQEAGSLTAKDALMIQRINAQANFGLLASYAHPAAGRTTPLWVATLVADMGDTNRWWDYDYFYFEDGSLASNTQITFLASGRFSPWSFLELRASYQYGDTGSKVERKPSYWASKRNDNASTMSVQVRPTAHSRVLVESARYVWGPRATSAQMVGVSTRPIVKRGFDVTAEVWQPLSATARIGGSLAYERIGRADSLVRYLATEQLYGVTTGRRDEKFVGRLYVDVSPTLRVGFYRTVERNPFPWISGIGPVEGPRAMVRANTNKWGIMTRLQMK